MQYQGLTWNLDICVLAYDDRRDSMIESARYSGNGAWREECSPRIGKDQRVAG